MKACAQINPLYNSNLTPSQLKFPSNQCLFFPPHLRSVIRQITPLSVCMTRRLYRVNILIY
jgi:hypothetical protein